MYDDSPDPSRSSDGGDGDCGRWWCAYETHLDFGERVALTSHHLTLGHAREASDDAAVAVELVGVGVEPPTLLLTRTPDDPDDDDLMGAPMSRWVARMDPVEAARLVMLVLRGVNKVMLEPEGPPSSFNVVRGELSHPGAASPALDPSLSMLAALFPAGASVDLLLTSLRDAGVVLHANDLAVAKELAGRPFALDTVIGWVRDLQR